MVRVQHRWMLAAALWTGCGNDVPVDAKGGAVVDNEDGDGDGSVGRDVPIVITADHPAFYSGDGLVQVQGTIEDGTIGEIEVLTIDGEDATLLDGMRFEGEVALDPGEPWRVVDIHVQDDNLREGTIQVQVGRAAASGTDFRSDELGLMAGPEALDTLLLHLGTFVRPADLAPPAGRVLRRTCDGPGVPGVEDTQVTEQLDLLGTASVRSIAGDVFTDDEALHVDLQGTKLVWDAELTTATDLGMTVTDATVVLTLGYGDDLPHSPCDGIWVPVTRAVEPVSWSVEIDTPPNCFENADVQERVQELYAEAVPPELDRASCAWAEWLDSALESELSGVTTERAITIDRAGLALELTATPHEAPPVQVAAMSIELAEDGLGGRLGPGVLGPAMQAATLLSSAELGEDTLSGQTLRWSRTTPDPAVTTLAASEAGSTVVLPTPVGFRIDVGEGLCTSEGHVVPGPGVVETADDADGALLRVSAEAVGADVVNHCRLSESQWSTVLASVLASALDGSARWSPATGLMLRGASTVSAVDEAGVAVEVGIPVP